MNILEYQFTQAYYPINDVGTILLGSNINLHFFDKNLLISLQEGISHLIKTVYFAQFDLLKVFWTIMLM